MGRERYAADVRGVAAGEQTCISSVAARSSACCTAFCSTCSFTSALAALCDAFSASARVCSTASSARFALRSMHANCQGHYPHTNMQDCWLSCAYGARARQLL